MARSRPASTAQTFFTVDTRKKLSSLVSIRRGRRGRDGRGGRRTGVESLGGGSCWCRRAGCRPSLLVVLFGFFVLGLLAYRTYRPSRRCRSASSTRAGGSLYTGQRHPRGPAGVPPQRAHGVRLGVRARRLPRPGLHRRLPAPRVGLRRARLRRRAARTRAARRTIADFRTNRYDEGTRHADADRAAGRGVPPARRPLRRFFSDPTTKHGLRPDAITDRTRAAPADRLLRAGRRGRRRRTGPGHNYSYTNNWPPEPRVDNKPTANVIVWSVLSLIALLGGIGILFARLRALGRFLGWHGREQATLSFRAPGDVALTPAQRATRLVLLRDGRAVPDPDVRRRRLAALPRRDRRASSASTSRRSSRTT